MRSSWVCVHACVCELISQGHPFSLDKRNIWHLVKILMERTSFSNTYYYLKVSGRIQKQSVINLIHVIKWSVLLTNNKANSEDSLLINSTHFYLPMVFPHLLYILKKNLSYYFKLTSLTVLSFEVKYLLPEFRTFHFVFPSSWIL